MADETYELIPIGDLVPGDVIFLMGDRYEVTAELFHPPEMRPELVRIPMAKLDGTDKIGPPFERHKLVPVRKRIPDRAPGASRPYKPDLASQDNDLIGLDIDGLLTRLRILAGSGEMIYPDMIRQLDSWMSRGFPQPEEWRRGEFRKLRAKLSYLQSDIHRALETARQFDRELHDYERNDWSSQ